MSPGLAQGYLGSTLEVVEWQHQAVTGVPEPASQQNELEQVKSVTYGASSVHFPCGLQNRAGLPPQSRENNRVEPFQNAFLWPLFSQSTYSYVSGGWQFKVWAEVGAKLSPETGPSVPRRQNLRQIVVGTSINNERRLYVFGALKNPIYRLLCAKHVSLCRRLTVTNVLHLMSTV